MNRPTNKPTTHGWRRWLALWGVCCAALAATAQTSVEYFWDVDPGYGNAISVAVTPSNDVATVNFDVSVEDLSEGVHRFCFRSYDEGGWSPTVQYYVRVESGEPQLITAIEYFWDEDPGFGNGTPINFNPATAVDLSEYVLDVNGMTGDHLLCIRAKSKGGWSPLLTQVIACTAEGNYTLNDEMAESVDRNFQSLDDMFNVLSTRHVSGDVIVTARDGASFTYDATKDGAMEMLKAVTNDLNANKARITFASTSSATISIIANKEDVVDVIALCAGINLDKVTLQVNSMNYDFSPLCTSDEKICSGEATDDHDFSKMGDAVTVSWTAAATSKKYVTGYETSGEGNLPSMTLTNTGEDNDYVTYTISVYYEEVSVHTATYNIYVQPSIATKKVEFVSSTPKDGSMVDPGLVTIKWDAVSGAILYEVIVVSTAPDGKEETTTTEQPTISMQITAEPGYSYIYKVSAIGPCDVTAESSRGFTVFYADADDLAALRVLYEACGGKDWKKQWSVDADVVASTNYPGVTFNSEGRVTDIDLSAYGLTGKLPEEGFCLPELTTLTLNNNSITELTAGLSLPELTTLDLGSNHVSELLTSGFNLPKLATLNLSNNKLDGELPTEALNLPALTTLNLSRNSLTGNVPASLLKECALLTSLDLSYNQLTAVEDALPVSIASLNLNNQHRVYGSSTDLHELTELSEVEIGLKSTLEDVDLRQSSLMAYNHGGKSYATFDLYDVTLKELYGRLTYTEGFYHLTFLNTDYKQPQDAELMMVAFSGYAKGSVQPVVVSYVEADANVDQLVDVKDVQHTLNYVVAEEGADGLFNWSAANTFDDELINIQDVVVTVNRVLENTNATAQARARRMTAAARAKAHGRLYVEDGYLCLEADTAVAALDVELQGTSATQIRLILLGSDWQMMSRATDEGVRLVIFSPTGKTLAKGTTQLLALRADKVSPIAAEAADAKARALTIAVEGGDATGLDAAELTEALTARIQDGVLYVESTMECEGVTLTLYDPAGRQLVQYADVALQAGSNVWSVGTAQQGIYLLQVRMANGTTDVIRIAAK